MTRPVLLEVTSKPIAPEILAAYQNGTLDPRSIPPGHDESLLQIWALGIFGPSEASAYAFGTALRKLGQILGLRGQKRAPADPGGGMMHPMTYVDTPSPKQGNAVIVAQAREAAGQVIEELSKAGYEPVEGRAGAGLIALTNILTRMCQNTANRPRPAAPLPPVRTETTVIKRRFMLEDELEDLPTDRIGDGLRNKMAKDLTNIAKDILHHQETRNMSFLGGTAKTVITIKFEGINDEDGLPVAYIRAVVRAIERNAVGEAGIQPYALIKIFHDVDKLTVTRSPGKVVFADIIFEPTRGQELAKAFTKWLEKWVPIHATSVQASKSGRAVYGAGKEKAHKQTMRLSDEDGVVDLTDYGFTGNGELLARLFVNPLTQRAPGIAEDGIKPFRVFSLHRTAIDQRNPQVMTKIEEDVLVAASLALDDDSFTLYGLLFGDQFRNKKDAQLKIISALIGSIINARIESVPDRFTKPIQYKQLSRLLSPEEYRIWEEYGSEKHELNKRSRDQDDIDANQKKVNEEVTKRLMVDAEITRKFPDPDRRETIIGLAIEEALDNPRGIDVTDPKRLFLRVKLLAKQRRSDP